MGQDSSQLQASKNLAFAHLQQGRLNQAKAIYSEICQADDQDAGSWFLLGAVNGTLGLLDEAIACCRNAIRINPLLADAYLNLGVALERQGKLAEAAESYRAVLKIKSDHQGGMEGYQRVALRIGTNQVLAITIQDGVRVCVPGTIHLMTPYVLLEQEDWFEDEISFVRLLTQPGMKVVDIGANYGVYTLAMAKRVGLTGRVWAFEPASSTASFLMRSIELNGLTNVNLVKAALSNHTGTARLSLQQNSELNSLNTTAVNGASETIEVTTLDGYAQQHGWRDIEFIKLDAEGEEANIILGGQRTLSELSPLIMYEIKSVDRANLSLVEQFSSLGYQTYQLLPGLQLLAPFNPADPFDPYQLNLFCCKPDRAAILEARGLLARSITEPPPEVNSHDTWRQYFQSLTYASSMAAGWGSSPGHRSLPGEQDYLASLGYYVSAHSAKLPAVERVASLRYALMKLNTALGMRETAPRQLTYARIAWELGLRSRALQCIASVLAQLDFHRMTEPDEPFLAVSPRYDHLEPGNRFAAWCEASLREQLSKLQAYSSFFWPPRALQNLEVLSSLGFMNAETERRRQLIRLRYGLQEIPQANLLLKESGPENLNAEFWNNTSSMI
jgi:FkbM family methyltransferase